jgi:ribonuclease HI
MDNIREIIQGRKLILCRTIRDWSVPELLRKCPECEDFLLYCCACNNQRLGPPRSRRPATPCHHYRIVFTDGACTKNGQPTAKAGIGAVCGIDEGSQISRPVTDMVDDYPLRSNQRAELCAAKLGLELVPEANTKEPDGGAESWIIATDSEYVVKGMTEWLPIWKVCSR